MKRTLWRWMIVLALVLNTLVIPIPEGTAKDGGTKVYSALTYKIVDWNRLTSDGVYDQTRVYWFPDNFQSLNALWEREKVANAKTFVAMVVEINGNSAVVEPVIGSNERASSDRITFPISDLQHIGAEPGSYVEVAYTGAIRESYPASIDAVDWKITRNLRHLEYAETWLDKSKIPEYVEGELFSHIVITAIYADCFFARPIFPTPNEIKLNGVLPNEWCIGDQIITTHENLYYDPETNRMEADFLTIEASDYQLDPGMAYKPVIYLYPEKETEVSVKLALEGKLTCTYPQYENGWKVTAAPDGTITDARGQSYNYLYWEGETYAKYDMTKGFCVRGEDTAAFLEDALEKLGLTRREANEFIVYWLPLMQENPYNIISFQTDAYIEAANLQVSPSPDTLIRVFMAWQAADSYVELEEQQLTAPARTGFTVVEWGGTELFADEYQ